jgi:hypothetical protein
MRKARSKQSYAGGFLLLPTALLCCSKFRALSGNGVKLLLDIGSQFNGKNNGDLCAAWKVMQPKGWKSEATLNRAKQELLAAGFIAETRKGRLPNLCSLYGITWQPLNPNAKLDIGPNGFPAGAWAELPRLAVKKNASPTTETVARGGHIATVSVVELSPLATENVAMRSERAVL